MSGCFLAFREGAIHGDRLGQSGSDGFDGTAGSIAVSVVFFSDKNHQAVGVGWMEISDAASASAFADELRAAARTSDKKGMALAEAMSFSVPLFGTETGGASNGFESSSQVLTVLGDGEDDKSQKGPGLSYAEAVQASSQDALLAGVDMINAISLGGGASVESYYTTFVVGGAVGGLPGSVVSTTDLTSFEVVSDTVVLQTVGSAMPETGVLGLCAMGWLNFLRRSRRDRCWW